MTDSTASVRVSICFTVLLVGAAVNLPVPLYGQYTMISGMGGRALGAAFACYGIGVLPALFFFGGLSDRIGRRLPLVLALVFSIAAIAAVSLFPGVPALAMGRLAQGVAIGLLGASATAFLAEYLPEENGAERAAGDVTLMLSLGFAVGGLATGAALLPGPTLFPASYAVHMAGSVVAIAMLLRLRYTVRRHNTPPLRLPYMPAGALWFCVANGSAWCLVGAVLCVVPYELTRLGLPGLSGLTTFLMPLVGVLCQQTRNNLKAINAVRLGLALAPLGCLSLAMGIASPSIILILAGAALSGAAGLGFGFHGGLRAIAVLSGSEKARGAAAFFLSCYLGLCSAPLALGWLSEGSTTAHALMILFICLGATFLSLEAIYQVTIRRSMQSNAA
jgi:MFS family permease